MSIHHDSTPLGEMAIVLNRSCLQVPSTLDALNEVLSWFEGFKDPLIPHSIWLQCQLGLAEGFTNAVRHAHHSLPETTPIDLELILFPAHLELRIWDHGDPFDLKTFLATLPPVHPDQEGGRGVLMMKAIATQLHYDRQEDGRNCLLIVKDYADVKF